MSKWWTHMFHCLFVFLISSNKMIYFQKFMTYRILVLKATINIYESSWVVWWLWSICCHRDVTDISQKMSEYEKFVTSLWHQFVMSHRTHSDIKCWYQSVTSLWYQGVTSLWYQSVTSLWYQSVTSLWYQNVTSLWHPGDIAIIFSFSKKKNCKSQKIWFIRTVQNGKCS